MDETERGALGAAKALHLIGDIDKRKREGRKPPMALCPSCSAPLIATFAYSGYEFLCLECGRHVTFLGPKRGDGDDPELQKRYEELKAEWDEHAGGLMPRGTFWREGCASCKTGDGGRLGHWEHVTDEERKADEEARAWLGRRTGDG